LKPFSSKHFMTILACSALLLGAGPCAVTRSGDDLCVDGAMYVDGVCVTDEPVESADNTSVVASAVTTQKLGGTGFIFGGGPQFFGPNIRNPRSITGAGDERWVAIAMDTVTSDETLIVVAGYGKSGTGATVPLIARFDTYGRLDTTFNSPKGYVVGADINPYGGTITIIKDMKLDSEGRIVIAGYATSTGEEGQFATTSEELNHQHTYLARYTAAGALDTGFGSRVNPTSTTSLRFGVVLEPFKTAPAQDPSTSNVGGYFGGTTGTAGYTQNAQVMNSFNGIAIDEYDGVIAVGQLGYDTDSAATWAWRGQALMVRVDYNGDYYQYFYKDVTNEKDYKGYLRIDFEPDAAVDDHFDTLNSVYYDSSTATITAVGGTQEDFLGTTANKNAMIVQIPSTGISSTLEGLGTHITAKAGSGYAYQSIKVDASGNFVMLGWQEDGINTANASGCEAPAPSDPPKLLERESFVDLYSSALALTTSNNISNTGAISAAVDFATATSSCTSVITTGAASMVRDSLHALYIQSSTDRVVVGGHVAWESLVYPMDDPSYSIGGSYHHYSILYGLTSALAADGTFGTAASMMKSSSYSATTGYGGGGADAILALTQDEDTGYLYGAGYSVQYISSGGSTGYYRQALIVRYDSTGAALK